MVGVSSRRRLLAILSHLTHMKMDVINEEQTSDGEQQSANLTVNSNDDYVLTRDAAASARLNLSHYIWLASFGFNLHPRIEEAIEGKERLKIADVGLGTG